MNKPIIIETRTKFSTLILLILAALFFGFLSYYLTSKSFESEYPQIGSLIIGLFFGVFGLASVFSILLLKNYHFDGKKLIVKSIFNITKKVIYVKDIKNYNEIEKENKYVKWKDLTIFTNKQKEKISSLSIPNYYQLKSTLTKGVKRDEYSESFWAYKVNKRYGIGFVIFGLLFTSAMINNYSNRELKIQPEELTTIIAFIVETPEIEDGRINLRIADYPKFKFHISGVRFSASYANSIVTEIKAKDKIEIDIFKDICDKKLIKSKALTFKDKTVNYEFITVNGLRKGSRSYLSLEDINVEHYKDSTGFGFWIFLTAGIGIALSGVYVLIRNRPVNKIGS